MAFSPMDLKRMKVEYMRVAAAKAEMELQIDQKNEEIDRIKANIVIQDNKLNELKDALNKQGVNV